MDEFEPFNDEHVGSHKRGQIGFNLGSIQGSVPFGKILQIALFWHKK